MQINMNICYNKFPSWWRRPCSWREFFGILEVIDQQQILTCAGAHNHPSSRSKVENCDADRSRMHEIVYVYLIRSYWVLSEERHITRKIAYFKHIARMWELSADPSTHAFPSHKHVKVAPWHFGNWSPQWAMTEVNTSFWHPYRLIKTVGLLSRLLQLIDCRCE
jgi:hypothetical protein